MIDDLYTYTNSMPAVATHQCEHIIVKPNGSTERCRLVVRGGTLRCAAGHLQSEQSGQGLLFDPTEYTESTPPNNAVYETYNNTDDETAQQLMGRANVLFDVITGPVWAPGEDDRQVIEGRQSVMRADTLEVLGDVGAAWAPIDNKLILDALEDWEQIEEEKLRGKLESVQVFGHGQMSMMDVVMPNLQETVAGQSIDARTTIVNGFDGRHGLAVYMTARLTGYPLIIGVSTNIDSTRISKQLIRHTKSGTERTTKALQLAGLIHKAYGDFTEVAQRMQRHTVQDPEEWLTRHVFRDDPDGAEETIAILRTHTMIPQEARDTAWGIFLATCIQSVGNYAHSSNASLRSRSEVSGQLAKARQNIFHNFIAQLDD